MRNWTPKDREPLVKIVQDILASFGLPFKPEQHRDVFHVEYCYWEDDKGEFFVIEDVTNKKAELNLVGCAGYYDVSRERGER